MKIVILQALLTVFTARTAMRPIIPIASAEDTNSAQRSAEKIQIQLIKEILKSNIVEYRPSNMVNQYAQMVTMSSLLHSHVQASRKGKSKNQ